MSVCAAIFVSHWKEWTKLNFLYYFSLRSAIVLSCQISIIQNQILSFFLLITASSQDKKTSLVMNLKPFLQTKYTFVAIHLHIHLLQYSGNYTTGDHTLTRYLETTLCGRYWGHYLGTTLLPRSLEPTFFTALMQLLKRDPLPKKWLSLKSHILDCNRVWYSS